MAQLQNRRVLEKTMAADITIKNVPEATLHRLRARAERNRRSLQMELLAIVETASLEDGPLTVDESADYVRGLGISSSGDDMTAWIREVRDSRSALIGRS